MLIIGNKSLLDEKLAVIVNSSQSKTPCGNDAWIRQTSQVVFQLTLSGYTIITSTGLSTWELTIFLVNENKGKQIIISPISGDGASEGLFNEICKNYSLNSQKTAMLFVKPDEGARSPKENWLKRDKAALSLAHKIAPVSIRPGGRLKGLLADESFSSRCIDEYIINFEKPLVGPKHYEPRVIKDLPDWHYITHWTKTCHGPWPGEPRGVYYRRLVSSGDEYPNRAFNTLGNIVKERRIRASSNKMREGRLAVGFTAEPPARALGLMRWCPKRVNWNFEPYGVAIGREIAAEQGIRPVIYGNENNYQSLSETDKPYFQSLGRSDVDWSRECEWRKTGDLDLTSIPSDKIMYLVWEQSETKALEDKVSGQIIALKGN